MMGATVELDAAEVAALEDLLRRLGGPPPRDLLEDLAFAGEQATRARIEAGGPAPDGSRWPPRTHDTGKPLLNASGRLGTTIDSRALAGAAEWGASLRYARIHQFGGVVEPRTAPRLVFEVGGQTVSADKVVIPARPYLGWGPDEERLAGDVVAEWWEEAAR